jgi:peptidoglycan/xylan/chitin deacetylase (PgdA/CDA1 family)
MRLIIAYHDIAPQPSSPWCVAPEVFRQHLETLKRTGFELVSVRELLAEPTSSQRRQCAITFDDGRIGALNYGAAVLEEFGARGTFYLCPSFIDGMGVPVEEQYSSFITWADVRALLARGHCIGSHGMSHARLSELSVEALHFELSESKKIIEREIGVPCNYFASPYGEMTPQIKEKALALGYESVASILPLNTHEAFSDDILPRYQVHQGDDFNAILHDAEVRVLPCVREGDFRIRLATDWDGEKTNQLFNKVFQKHRGSAEYQWRFKENPWFKELPLRSVICERGDSLVGIYPLMSTKWKFYDETLWSLHALDNCIVEECRGSGVQRAMHSLMSSEILSTVGFGFGFPADRAFLVGTRALGYRPIGNFTALSAEIERVNVAGNAEGIQVVPIDRFGDEHDRWWQRHGAQLFPVIIPRSSHYLNWRFADHPFRRFRLLHLVGPDGILGYAVVGFAMFEGKVVGTIYDLLCAREPAAINSLIRACVEIARKHRAHTIQCWLFQHVPYYAYFEQSGFAPVENTDVHFIISAWQNDDFEKRCIASAHDWFVTLGDSDR